MEPYSLTVEDVAGRFHVSGETVRRWARDGSLPGITTLGGHWRFSESGLAALVASRSNQDQEASA